VNHYDHLQTSRQNKLVLPDRYKVAAKHWQISVQVTTFRLIVETAIAFHVISIIESQQKVHTETQFSRPIFILNTIKVINGEQ